MFGFIESIFKNWNKVVRFINIFIDKIMNIGYKEIFCINFFDVWIY